MDICEYTPYFKAELKPFIEKCVHTPFKEYDVSQDLSANYIIEELSDITSNHGFVFVAKNQSEIIGLIASERLEWDSTHFGFEISKITHLLAVGNYFETFDIKQKLISHLLSKCYSILSLHLSARVSKEDLSSIHALENKSFRLMDVLVTYSFDLRKQKWVNTESPCLVRKFRQADLPLLEDISISCFRDSPVATDRFHADPVLDKKKSDELYVKWIVDSLQDSSNEILVAEMDGRPIGFNLCTVNKSLSDKLGIRFGSIALTAVQPSERHKLVATSLLNASLAWFTDKVDIVETGGQVSNYAVQRAWSKVGFKITRSQCTFHWSVLPDDS